MGVEGIPYTLGSPDPMLKRIESYESALPSGLDARVERMLAGDGWRLTPATTAMKLSRGWWQPAKHLLYVSTIIASAIHRGDARIIVSMPPRHGKSELLSVWTPVYVLDHDPDKHIILTSYGADLATGFGRRVRDIINERQDILHVSLNRDSQRVDQFLTTGRGGMFSVGIGGPVTGRGADVLLVDDFVKNAKDAASETIRQDIIDWFLSTAHTRLEPGGSIIILATRWNISDLIGYLKKRPETGNWLIIELPALAEENDPLGRQPGEALWPSRFGRDRLLAIKGTLGSYFWQALYQQRPLPMGANVASESWFPVIDDIVHRSRLIRIRYWDLAATHDGGDFSAGALCSWDPESGIFYIEDVRRFQKSPARTEVVVQTVAEADAKGSTPVKTLVEQEPGASGKIAAEHYVKTVLKGYTADYRRVTGPKFIRAQGLLAAAEAGKVRLLRGSWNEAFVNEILLFPDGDFDDQVDAASGAYNELTAPRQRAGTWGRSTPAGQAPLPGGYIQGATWGR